jgi:serine/threonine protein kinase
MKTCLECGRPLSLGVLGDRCARCLLEEGLSRRPGGLDPDALDSEPAIGHRCGDYEILAEIGHGGVGTVYRACRLADQQFIALKVLSRRLIYSPESLGRFVREARIASCLDHPAICKVHEVGQAAGWGWFIAMELVPGPTLKAKLRCGPLEPNEVLDIALPVSDALETAHAKGIVHRDIKSSNLSFGELGRVKLLDFGLAKWLALEESTLGPGTEFHTRGGSVLGSAGYMSPEQALGRTLDHRTDLFSLGVVLYEALTGRLPFGGSTFREIVHQTVHDEPEPIHRINARVPPALEQIINRCLQKDPTQRYPSAAALRGDFQNLMPAGPRPSGIDWARPVQP